MSEAEDGFLAEPLDHVRAVIRERYADHRSLVHRVNRLAVSAQHSIVIHIESGRERYAAVLFARTLASTQAAVLLLEIGMIAQARTLLRSAIETFFTLTALAKDPAFLDDLMDHHAAEQKRVAKSVQLWQHPDLKEIAVAESAAGQLDEYLASSASGLQVVDIARRAGLEDWYRTVYMVFSWSTHGAAMDLDRHAVVGADGEIVEFRNEPEIDDQESSWLCAIEILLTATSSLSLIFPGIDRAGLDQCYNDAYALKAAAVG